MFEHHVTCSWDELEGSDDVRSDEYFENAASGNESQRDLITGSVQNRNNKLKARYLMLPIMRVSQKENKYRLNNI